MQNPTIIISLLLVGVFCLIAYFEYQKRRKGIIENGIEVDGIVFDFTDDNSGVSFNSSDSNIATPVIRFVTKEGLWITEKGDWSATWLKQGDKVKVIYKANNPKEFIYRTSMDWSSILVYLLPIGGVVCLGIGLWFAYLYLSNPN